MGVTIAFGNLCIEIHCQDQGFMEKAQVDYYPFLVSRQPDFRIEFNLKSQLSAREIARLLPETRSYIDHDQLITEPELLRCRIDWAKAALWVEMEKEIFAPSVEYKLMNLLLRGVYCGVYKRVRGIRPEAYLVHGCGILDGRRGYLFTGPSGAGKTTIAKLSDGRKVLNDEAILIGRNKEGFHIAGTPLDGGVSHRCNDQGCLSTILFLRQDTEVSLQRLSGTEVYRRLLAQMFDTSPLLEAANIDSLPERADLAAEVATSVPSYELGFLPDNSFWEAVETI